MVSFFGGALAGLPFMPAMPGRGEFFISLPLVVNFGLGVALIVGGTARSSPMLGKGATGFCSCFTGRLGPVNPENG